MGLSLFDGSQTASPLNTVIASSRDLAWVEEDADQPNVFRIRMDLAEEASVMHALATLGEDQRQLNCVLNCSGLLHGDGLDPERTWRHLDPDSIRRVFDVNLVAVGMAIKHLLPLLPKRERGVFMSLSARVGSIGDNRLGGWYSYRASKAAQNMYIKCAAIEAGRTRKELVCVALHPGTVDTALSKPFTRRTPSGQALLGRTVRGIPLRCHRVFGCISFRRFLRLGWLRHRILIEVELGASIGAR